jgi:hypothetical protein
MLAGAESAERRFWREHGSTKNPFRRCPAVRRSVVRTARPARSWAKERRSHLVQELCQPRPPYVASNTTGVPGSKPTSTSTSFSDIIGDVPVEQFVTVLVGRSDLRASRMDVQSHVHDHGHPSIETGKVVVVAGRRPDPQIVRNAVDHRSWAAPS